MSTLNCLAIVAAASAAMPPAITYDATNTLVSNGGDEPMLCGEWTNAADLTPALGAGESDAFGRLIVDSAGNVWVFNAHVVSGAHSIQAIRSNGHNGTWQPIDTISFSTPLALDPEATIDSDDRITVVFHDVSGSHKLYAMRYTPQAGWAMDPELVHVSDVSFQATEVAVDEAGNVITAFDPFDGTRSVWTAVRDAETDAWQDAEQVSLVNESASLPTLASNDDGSIVYLIYAVEGAQSGLYAHRWNSGSRSWEARSSLPGSEEFAAAGFVGAVSRLPATIGGDGEATVMWQRIASNPTLRTLFASRTNQGVWQLPVVLLPASPDFMDVVNFASIDSGEHGDVIGVVSRIESGTFNRVSVARYSDGVWQPTDTPYESTLISSTRVRAAMYRGRRAVVTVYGEQDGVAQLTSLFSNGGAWWSMPIDIPGEFAASFHELIADGSDVALVYEAQSNGNQGIKAAWWLDPTGDLDCDSFVDVNDLLLVLGNWGECGIDSACPSDLDGDGVVGILDLLHMLGNWA